MSVELTPFQHLMAELIIPQLVKSMFLDISWDMYLT